MDRPQTHTYQAKISISVVSYAELDCAGFFCAEDIITLLAVILFLASQQQRPHFVKPLIVPAFAQKYQF